MEVKDGFMVETDTPYRECLSIKELKSNYYKQLPKIGDIIVGELSSNSKKDYGYFVDIGFQSHSPKYCKISGLLHKSNYSKSSPWSINNIKEIDLYQKKILTEIIDITEKGFSLKEIRSLSNISLDTIMNSDDVVSIEMVEVNYVKKRHTLSTGSYVDYLLKDMSNKYKIYYTKQYNALLFNNKVFECMYMPHDNSFYSNENEMIQFTNKLDKFTLEIGTTVLEDIESVNEYNELEISHKQHHLDIDKKNVQKNKLYEELNQLKPYKSINMYSYITASYDESPKKDFHGYSPNNNRNAFTIHKFKDIYPYEEIKIIEIYKSKKMDEQYLKIDNKYFTFDTEEIVISKDTINNKYILINENTLIYKTKGRYAEVVKIYFKSGFSPNKLLTEYIKKLRVGWKSLEGLID